MSEKNPNVNDVLSNSTGIELMRSHLCKSYLNLAKTEFWRRHKRKPAIADSQELYDIYESAWKDYYIDKPVREKKNKQVGEPIWNFGKSFGIEVHASLCEFLRNTYPVYKTNCAGELYNATNAAEIMKEKKIEFMETYIIENNLLEAYKNFVRGHSNTLKKYHKPVYEDFGHLAYNGVTDDF